MASNQDEDYSAYYSGNLEEPCYYSTSHMVAYNLSHYVQPIICILGVLGNVLVMVTYARYKRVRSMTDVLLVNVAVADLLFSVTLALVIVSQLWAWPEGVAACKLLRGSYSVNLYSGTLLLACVSVDRYIAIVQARRSFRLRSLTYGRLICGIVWLTAILLSVPSFYFYTWYQPSHTKEVFTDAQESHDTGGQYVCEFHYNNSEVAKAVKVAVPSTQMAVGFFLPLAVMTSCYGAILVTLLKAKNFQRHKAVRVVLAVVAVFVMCQLPYNVALLYDTVGLFQEEDCLKADAWQTALEVTQTLAFLHCCLNPPLYAFVGVKFRSYFCRIFWDLRCVRRPSLNRRRSSRLTSDVFVSSVRRSADASSETGSSFTM